MVSTAVGRQSGAALRARDLDEGQALVSRIYCETRHELVRRPGPE